MNNPLPELARSDERLARIQERNAAERREKASPLPGQTNPSEGRQHGIYRRFGKRWLDILLGLFALVLCSPVLLVAMLAVRVTSKGPVFFIQPRVGMDGKPFTLYKLRSMYIDQEARVDVSEIEQQHAKGLLYKPKNDPRITPVGKLIRKTSVDELPQLWNVLRGDMSLVGPRPLMIHMLEPFPDVSAKRCRVRPGITGLWQVSAREENTSAECMVRFDFEYVDRCSLWYDLWILLRTPWTVIKMAGAH